METAIFDDISVAVEQARQGDTAAFAGIVRRYQSLVSGVLFSATGDFHQSEDLAQETFLIAWHKLGDLKNSADLAPWLCTIARNLAHRSFRKKQPVTDVLFDEKASDAPGPVSETLRREQTELVWSAIAKIPEPYRESLVLYYRSGQSIAEIATVTASSEEAVRQRLVRARKSLKVKLEELIGNILTDTAPGDFFTLGVMTAVTTGVVIGTGETLLAASTATTTATATGAAAGKMTGVSLFWAILGPLAYFFCMFTFLWVATWASIRNIPTLQARRLKLYNIFWRYQYGVIYCSVIGIAAACTAPFANRFPQGGYFLLTVFIIMIPTWSVVIPMQKRNARLTKEKLEYELGLRDSDTFPCDFSKVVRRFHLALFTNLLLAETLLLLVSVAAVNEYSSDPTAVLVTLGIGGVVLGLVFPACYLLGRHLLGMCRARESLQTMPPLIDDTFHIVLGKTLKSISSIDHPERARKMHSLMIFACLMFAASAVWFFSHFIDWNRNPVPSVVCIAMIVASFAVYSFFFKRFRNNKKTFLLGQSIFGFVLSGTTLLLLMFQAETFSLEGLWQLFVNPKPFLLGHTLMPTSLIFFFMSLVQFLQWAFYKEKAEKHERYSHEELEAAIARYEPPEEPENETRIAPFPTVWRWIVILYGVLSFAVIAFGVMFWSL
ncbi:MAG: sigma-70 family RNA polymerase sigma factor [Planctomycetaceae bacterium]|nr:sigma-70 family RNA polymerase sigma factor [Planctomycetaceae bacterium]